MTQHSAFDVARPDVTLRVREHGRGPVLLVLAGGPGMNAAYMEPLVTELARDHRCVVPDQRGTGGSRLARIDATTLHLAAYVADVEAVREKLGLPALALVGHSWGALLAMIYAARHPGRVERLVLIGPAGPTSRFLAVYPDNLAMRLRPEDLKLEAEAMAGPDVEESVLRARMPGYFFSRELGVKARALVVPGSLAAGVAPIVLGGLGPGFDLTPELAAIRAPALVIQGRQDPVGESTAIEVRDAIPGASLVWLERCGHFPWLEARERLYLEVRSFLGAAV
jgi:proline iminopeptidase